jgi:AcrR family transcriptional regulator
MADGARNRSNPGATREALVRTAVQLFAEHGLDGVSLAEINRAAGQRNATALHYHFGGKEGLIQAIFDKHSERVNSLRESMLERLTETAAPAEIVALLVIPLAEQVKDDDGGIHYIQFLAQVMNNPRVPRGSLDRRESPVLSAQQQRFESLLAPLAQELRTLRMNFVIAMIFNSLAAYAAEVASQGWRESHHRQVVDELVDAAIRVLDFPRDSVSH